MNDIKYASCYNVYNPEAPGTPMLIVLAEKYIREHRGQLEPVKDYQWKDLCHEEYGGLFAHFERVPNRSDVQTFVSDDNVLGLTHAIVVKDSIVAARFAPSDEQFNYEAYQFRHESSEKVRTSAGTMLAGSQKWFFRSRKIQR
jgi:hypothetical protein